MVLAPVDEGVGDSAAEAAVGSACMRLEIPGLTSSVKISTGGTSENVLEGGEWDAGSSDVEESSSRMFSSESSGL